MGQLHDLMPFSDTHMLFDCFTCIKAIDGSVGGFETFDGAAKVWAEMIRID